MQVALSTCLSVKGRLQGTSLQERVATHEIRLENHSTHISGRVRDAMQQHETRSINPDAGGKSWKRLERVSGDVPARERYKIYEVAL